MMDARLPRLEKPCLPPASARDDLRAAWDWARQTSPAVKQLDRIHTTLCDIPVGGVAWVLSGTNAAQQTVQACITDAGQLTVMHCGPDAPIRHILLDLPAHLGGHPKAA